MTEQLDRLKAALADRYSIERELGSGGMATVYLARDLKHDRQVAVKVFRPELAAALGTERFFREIKITANLQHPHILPLHDSGEAGGFLYYVMPYVEGESLRDRLNRDKQLSVDEALKITSQVASALSYAHSRDIIHRDIKPENILFQAGEVVVADFGIALAVDSAGGTRLTETGLSLGTPAYMSPEQVAGDQVIDGRSDIYSLACVLHEMLAGDPPFVASNPRAVLAKHMTDPVPPITTVRSDVPKTVAATLTKALGKAPAARFDSAKAFLEALSATEVKAEEEKKSIVVLPFENLSPDPDNAFFADGLTEELIAELSGVRALRVISRTSAMQFKDTKKSVPTIVRELNVRYALEGSVRRAGDSVRITAQLIDGSTDSHLWAERYTGKLEDVFDLQEQLSRRIVEALRVALTPEEDDRLAARPIRDFQAYDALMRARQEIWKCSAESFERAKQLVLQAQRIAGDTALLDATLGYIYAQAYNLGIRHDREALQLADLHASKALASDPKLGLALYARAWIRYKEGDIRDGVKFARAAWERDRDIEAILFAGALLATVGKIDEARAATDEAVALDPLHPFTGFTRPWFELLAGHFDVASSLYRKLLDDVVPGDTLFTWFFAQALAHAGRLDDAKDIFARLAAGDTPMVADLSELYCRAADSDRDGVARLIEENTLMIESAKTDEWYPIIIADCLVMVGNEDSALEWLDRAVDWGFCNYRYLEEHDRFLKPLRGNPHFQQIIDKARQKHEAFDA